MPTRPAGPRPPRRARRQGGPIDEIYARLDRAYPDARLALDFDSPLQLLIALILAAQCTDAKVNEVTPPLFRRFPTARDLADVSQEELEGWIRPTGFYRQKAKAVRACCQALLDRFDGQVPRDLDALLGLPGVGRKTANILRGNAFGLPGIGVDTHVGRLAQRLGLTQESDPNRIEADLTAVVPPPQQIRICHLLQAHGRQICLARKPRCPQCVLNDLCPFPGKAAPAPPKTRPTKSRWIT